MGGYEQYLHLPEDSGSVVGDHHLPIPALDHLVHPPGAKAGPNRIGDRLCCEDVGGANILPKKKLFAQAAGLRIKRWQQRRFDNVATS